LRQISKRSNEQQADCVVDHIIANESVPCLVES
jgi:hypothetical protein